MVRSIWPTHTTSYWPGDRNSHLLSKLAQIYNLFVHQPNNADTLYLIGTSILQILGHSYDTLYDKLKPILWDIKRCFLFTSLTLAWFLKHDCVQYQNPMETNLCFSVWIFSYGSLFMSEKRVWQREVEGRGCACTMIAMETGRETRRK